MKKVFLQPMTVRIWHWVNALSFFVLVATGVQIRYRDIPNLATFKTSVDLHNFFGFLLIADFLLWFAFYVFTGKIRVYVPLNPKKFIVGALRQMRYYGYGMMIGEKDPHHATPEEKFNPLQQSAYFMVMLILMPLQVVSGILLWDIRMFAGWIAMLGGLRVVDIVHVVAFFLLTAFLFVHVYLTTLGRTPLAHIKAMFTGYEEVEENE
ncbi:MAG: cytochrome b/b6 domain-containing protein [Nitrospiraceae bacterium]|nr:cytochrome b/b6 domain-containing protein [Nitrospiraceae bacterium]